MADDPDTDAILERRRRLVALALSGLLPLSGCDAIAGPCLSPPVERPIAPPGPCLSAPLIPPTTPTPCLAPPPQQPEGPQVPADEPGTGTGTVTTPTPCLGPPPQVCLSVAMPPDEPTDEP